jgi:hypothetical protein
VENVMQRKLQLTGAALDWAVATCEGKPIVHDPMGFKSGSEAGYWIWDKTPKGLMTKIGRGYTPATNWSQGGPIIEREKLDIAYLSRQGEWYAYRRNRSVDDHVIDAGFGPTPLIAAMRCYVSAKLGERADVPAELMEVVS